MKKLFVAVACAGLALAGFSAAKTWTVDLADGNDAAAKADTTGATAFKTIQAAIDNASKGDTVSVGPGVCNTGATYIGGSATGQGGNTRCRIVINKTLTLVGAGRDKTFIVGEGDPNGNALGCGDDAVRCIGVSSSAGTDTVIRGFTICDGRTSDGANIGTSGTINQSRCGGGVFCWTYGGCTVVDCTIRNCGAVQAGAAHRAVLVRCKLFDNLTYVQNVTCTNWPCGSVSRYCYHYFCEIAGSRNTEGVYDSRATINCTFHSSGSTDIRVDSTALNGIYNCVFDHYSNNKTINANKAANLIGCVTSGLPLTNSSTSNCVHRGYGFLFAPALRDGHLVDTATDCFGIADPRAITGDTTLGNSTGVPEAYRDKDLDGNPIVLEFGKLNPGCYQTPKKAAGGLTAFYADGKLDLYVDGNFIRSNQTNYLYATSWPTQHTFRAVCKTAGYEFSNTKAFRNGKGCYTMLLPVDTNNFCRFMPAPLSDSYLFENYSAAQYWIDCQSTAETEDGSAAAPFKTIQNAVSTKPASVYRVKPGTYDKGCYTNATLGFVSRMGLKRNNPHRFIAEEGPEKTIIAGASDPEAPEEDCGCGTNAVRLVGYWFYDGVKGPAMSYFHGFTLTGGRTDQGRAASDSWLGQGAVCLAQIGGETQYYRCRSLMTDCIISNNVAGLGVFAGVETVRCLIADNHSIATNDVKACVLRCGYASGCVFRNNTGVKAVWGDGQYVIQCTMDDETLLNPFYDCNVYNCVVRAGDAAKLPRNTRGSVWVDFGASAGYPYRIRSEDLFADRSAGDYRLLDAATGAHYGISEISTDTTTAMPETWVRYFPDDFTGRALAFEEDGRLPPGAFQELVVGKAVSLSATQDRGISPTDFARFDDEGRVTLTASEAGTRAFRCFSVNGVEQPASGTTFTYVRPTPAPTAKDDAVAAVYCTDYYVNPDPLVGSDEVFGGDPDHPALTLSNVLSHCVSGDTAHAAPGVYDQKATLYPTSEKFDSSGDITVLTRAYIPSGVTLEATGSRDETIIRGAPSPEAYEGDYGCGPGATRCAVVRYGATLRGFTLDNGHTATKDHGGSTDPAGAKSGDNTGAGGAYVWETAKIENCVITNCVSGRSVVWGRGTTSTIRDSVIAHNRDIQDYLGLLRNIYADGCYVADNISYTMCYFMSKCANCTFGPGNRVPDSLGGWDAYLFRGNSNVTNTIVNSVIYTRNFSESKQCVRMTRCVLDGNSETQMSRIIETNDCIVTTRDNIQFEENGAPKVGANAAVDAGLLSDWTDAGHAADTDALGRQRVYNGRIDIGAVEGDWRAAYAKTLCRNGRFSVTAADPAVVAATNAAGAVVGVSVPAGKTLACAFAAGSSRLYTCAVDLAAGASVDVTLDGTTTTRTASGEVPLAFRAEGSDLLFEAKNGLALLNPFVNLTGSVLYLR